MTEADKLIAATQAFVRMLRREHERRKPGTPPLPTWEEMRPIDQASIMRCVQAAIQAKTAADSAA